MTNSLALLGLREGASLAEVRAAYIAAVKRRHPDLAHGELDRRRRTRDTADINAAYASLRHAPARTGRIPPNEPKQPNAQRMPNAPSEWGTPAQTIRPPSPARTQISVYEGVLPWLGPLAAAVAGGLLASSVAGNPALCVAVFVAFVVVGRWPKAVEVLK